MNDDNDPGKVPPKPGPVGEQPFNSGQMENGMKAEKDAKQFAMLAHLLGVLTGFIGPLIIYLVKKDEHPFVEQEAKEALNFHLTMLIGYLISMAIVVVTCGVVFFAPIVPAIISVIFGIMGTIESSNGAPYRYPMTIRMIK